MPSPDLTGIKSMGGTHGYHQVSDTPAATPVMNLHRLLILVPTLVALLAATPACDYCHSTATVVTRTYPSPGTTGVAAAK